MHRYPNFYEALRALGKTNYERAALLGVSRSTLQNYLRGDMLPPVEKVKRFKEIDDALTLDIRGEKSECQCSHIPA